MKNKPFDITTFGSITLDTFVELEEMKIFSEKEHDYFGFEVGQKIKMKTLDKNVGGGSANTAVGFAQMGLNTCCMGTIGAGNNGKFIMRQLQQKNIYTDMVHIQDGHPSSASIIIMNKGKDRTVFNEKACYEFCHTIPETNTFYCSHLSETESQIFPMILKWKKKNMSKIFAWNPGKTQFSKGFEFFKEIFSITDILIMNIEEAELFTNIEAKKISKKSSNIACPSFQENAAEEIYDISEIGNKFLKSGVKNCIITDGKRGAQFLSEKEHFYMPIADTNPNIHTLGAGDAFSVGVITLFLNNYSPREMMLGGTLNANSVVQYFGAQMGLLGYEELLKKLNSN